MLCGRLNHYRNNFTATTVYLKWLKQTAGGGEDSGQKKLNPINQI